MIFIGGWVHNEYGIWQSEDTAKKVNLCGVESCAHNLRPLAIAVTPLSIIGSDDQRMVSIKCRFEGAKRQSFENDPLPLRANTRTSWKAGESDGPATL